VESTSPRAVLDRIQGLGRGNDRALSIKIDHDSALGQRAELLKIDWKIFAPRSGINSDNLSRCSPAISRRFVQNSSSKLTEVLWPESCIKVKEDRTALSPYSSGNMGQLW
jgi:hypothetical protein